MTISFRDINRYEKVVRNSHSAPKKLTLNWLKLSFGLFTILLSADLISYLLNSLTDWYVATQFMQYVVLGMVMFFVNFLLIKGLKQPQIFLGISLEESTLIEDLDNLNKHLISHEYQNDIEKIQTYMETDHPYLNSSLTIKELSNELTLPMRRLSVIINGAFEQNFSEFINSYRIEAAKKRLSNPHDPNETILEVLYDVGFQSKSAFNTAFKKMTGKTPTAYKKQLGNTIKN